MTKNVLFIMCDQLRWDYLGYAGHPTIRTPNIDALAAKGVNFTRTYVQSPICGPSRACAYTGRYMRSHGATNNNYPLRAGEWTLGDHLKQIGARNVLCGKTHAAPDIEGMARLGMTPGSPEYLHCAEGGFEVWDRLDGLHPPRGRVPSHYFDYLRANGMDGVSPWHDWAAGVEGEDGEVLNGWLNVYAREPARVPEEHSETAYTTNRAIEFIKQADDRPWSLHLSYIKPHWPILVPAPYHAMYGDEDVIPVVRSEAEKAGHPIHQANHDHRWSTFYNRPGAREHVISTYMGLITQIDDHIGRLMAWMEETGRAEETLIIFTSDHGDYLGDHWMGEKHFLHDCSARVPMIVVDPSAEADATRGTTDDRLVEMIDVAPTIVDYMGGEVQDHILEGRSLLPLVRGETPDWRQYAISEVDYATHMARERLDQPTEACWMTMLFDGRWKYIHCNRQRPILFDLETDPGELNDLGDDPAYEAERARLAALLADWALTPKSRVTVPPARIEAAPEEYERGILIGFWDERELQETLLGPDAVRN